MANIRRKERSGTVVAWTPATGRGVVDLKRGGEVAFDMFKTEQLDKGYVDLFVGREVKVTVKDDFATTLRALGEGQPPGPDFPEGTRPVFWSGDRAFRD
jgi:hypothetical protein